LAFGWFLIIWPSLRSARMRSTAAPLFITVTGDPYGYVLSANIYRRHLTSEQKRTIIAALLKSRKEQPANRRNSQS
jgi:hypothetical protein